MLCLPGCAFDDSYMTQSRDAARTELELDRPIWTSDWVPVITGSRLSPQDIARLPLYVRYERDPKGRLVLPDDRNVLLSDELVYAAMKELSQKKRAEFRAVWDANGEPRASRIPQDPGPRIDFHGLPCAPIWKRYYAFVGLRAAVKYGYLMVPKADSKLKIENPVFTIGPIVLGYPFAEDAVTDPAAVFQARHAEEQAEFPYPRSVVRQLHNHHGQYTTLWKAETNSKMLDIGSDNHHHVAMLLQGLRPSYGFFWEFSTWSPSCSAEVLSFTFSRMDLKKMKIMDPVQRSYQNTNRPTWSSHGTQQECQPTTQDQPGDAISVSSSAPFSSPDIPEPQSQLPAVQSQLCRADTEEKILRDFILPYKGIMEHMDRVQPEIEDLKRLREHMARYRQLQLQEAALTEKTEAVAAGTLMTISNTLSSFPDIQRRAIRRWENLFHRPCQLQQSAAPDDQAQPGSPLLLGDEERGNHCEAPLEAATEGPPYDPGREFTPSDIYTPPRACDN